VGFGEAVGVVLVFGEDAVELVYLVDYGNAIAAVGELPRFDDPYVAHYGFAGFALFQLFLLFFNEICSFLMVMHKPFILWALQSIFYMKCQRQILKHILPNQLIVLFEAVKHCFFIA
jgi:hypothetical protein